MLSTYLDQLLTAAEIAEVDLYQAFKEAGVARSTFNRVMDNEFSLQERTAKKVAKAIKKIARRHVRRETQRAIRGMS